MLVSSESPVVPSMPRAWALYARLGGSCRTPSMRPDFFDHLRLLVQVSVSVWFVFWAWRRKYDTDEELGASGQFLRWAVVAGAYALTFLPNPSLSWVRVASFLAGLSFVAWPNLAALLVRSL